VHGKREEMKEGEMRDRKGGREWKKDGQKHGIYIHNVEISFFFHKRKNTEE